MKFAVNYSRQADRLRRKGKIQFDYFKCPAWPDVIKSIGNTHPFYLHFPLVVGSGIGDAIDTETDLRADWGKIETLLQQTNTPFVNLHLRPAAEQYPSLSVMTSNPAHIEMLGENMIRDVHAVVERFGAERVIVENVPPDDGQVMLPALLPQVIKQVVRETRCGFLLDLSHVRLAADFLGVNESIYASALPVDHLCEVHVTGIQHFDQRFVDLARQGSVDEAITQEFVGREIDHLPMSRFDWTFSEWAMRKIHSGAWQRPAVVAFEYGGVGVPWEAVTESDVLLEQVPRLREMVIEVSDKV